MHVCMYVYMYVCMYVCMYACTYLPQDSGPKPVITALVAKNSYTSTHGCCFDPL